MRVMAAIWLLALTSLSACVFPPSGQPRPQQGLQLDCRHFYRNAAGIWQADGNATALVNGRQWFLGIQQFTPSGPAPGGELLYNDIQRQCGGGLPTEPTVSTATPTLSGRCLPDGSKVTLSGRVTYRTVPPNNDDGLPGHHYARLTLDRPVCVLDGGFGGEPNGRTVAIVPEGERPDLRSGAHVTLTGTLAHKSTSNEPPEPLQFDVRP